MKFELRYKNAKKVKAANEVKQTAATSATDVDGERLSDAGREAQTTRGEKPKSTLHPLEKANYLSQITLVIIGAMAALIYGFQLHTMNQQLSEMRGSGTQTDRMIALYQQQLAQSAKQAKELEELAETTRAQAEAIKKQANTSQVIALNSLEQSKATARLAGSAEISAKESVASLALAQRQLETSNRAWISITAVDPLSLEYTTDGIWFRARFHFVNTGNMLAVEVRFFADFLVLDPDIPYLSPMRKAQIAACENALHDSPLAGEGGTQTVLVNQTSSLDYAKRYNIEVPMSSKRHFYPLFLGCATYKFASSATEHQTPFIYELQRRPTAGELFGDDLKWGQNYEGGELELGKSRNGEALNQRP